ncbi:HAD family hydrolase [Nonomuraea sp. NBC_01738]|uniref:HAD family hydrolase n=1 Tax=Nonomuraea sp. NBC_01738 TaxID=2976003 RepID=UPI002E0FDE82|nr:HAD family hydrolase [Nonomuraea sp. NBC_01738]
MQRLALFDLDNTLIDLDAAFRLWATEFSAEHGLDAEAAEWLVALDQEGLPHRESFFARTKARFSLPDPVDELWAAYRARMPFLVHCRPEVLAGLSDLRGAGWRVAIITNGTADNQLGKIQRTGLADVVDGYALSGVEGVRKPERGLFDAAARCCGLTLAAGGWMVGDRLAVDIAGGRAAGLRTIWVNPGRQSCVTHGADHVAADVVEAVTILRTQKELG